MRQVGMGMIQQMQVPCEDCGHTGEIAKDRCKKCKGKKVTVEKKFLDIFIEKGMGNGQKIVQKGEGDQEVKKKKNDVIFFKYAKRLILIFSLELSLGTLLLYSTRKNTMFLSVKVLIFFVK